MIVNDRLLIFGSMRVYLSTANFLFKVLEYCKRHTMTALFAAYPLEPKYTSYGSFGYLASNVEQKILVYAVKGLHCQSKCNNS